MTRLQPAPDAVLYLVKCGRGKDKCGKNKRSCRRAGLTCADLSSCSDDETGEACDNVHMIENDSCIDSWMSRTIAARKTRMMNDSYQTSMFYRPQCIMR